MTSQLAPPTTTDRISAINWTLSITPKPTTLENRQVLIRLVQTICAWLHVQQVDMCTHTQTHTLIHTAFSSNHTHTKQHKNGAFAVSFKIFATRTENPFLESGPSINSTFQWNSTSSTSLSSLVPEAHKHG